MIGVARPLSEQVGIPDHYENKLGNHGFFMKHHFWGHLQIDPPNGDLTHSDPTDRSAHASSRTTRPPPFSTAGSRGLGLSHQRTSPPTCWLALDCHSTRDPLNP